MAQMHSYLIMNAKSELKFISDEITLEELDETLNQIALSINNGIDLFDDNDLGVDFEDINEIEETSDLVGINDHELEIKKFINLSTSLLDSTNEDNEQEEEISIMNHGDLSFDVDELINAFDGSL
jgi:hypothetical protein